MYKRTILDGQLMFAVLASLVIVFATNLVAVAQADKPNKYGGRDARTCADTIAPAKGAITADLAKKYFVCNTEKVSGSYLYLVENEKVQVGSGRPYSPNADLGVPDINPKVPIYPLRGSYTLFQCVAEYPGYTSSEPGKNCQSYEYRAAKGECYKTTFGDWRCSMSGGDVNKDDTQRHVPPPK